VIKYRFDNLKVILFILLLFLIVSCHRNSNTQRTIVAVENDSALKVEDKVGNSVAEFEIQVPLDYNHLTQLDSFVMRNRNNSSWIISWMFTDSVFSISTNKLIPGEFYTVKIFPIIKQMRSEECIEFMKNQNAIMVNAQGLTLAFDLFPGKFPRDRWILSFDVYDKLASSPDVKYEEKMVPMIGNTLFNPKELHSYYGWDSGWGENYYMLCFFKKAETTR